MSVLAVSSGFANIFDAPGLPEFNPMMLLHGEQKIINYKPITPGQVVKTRAYVSDIADKIKGALLTITIELSDDEGTKLSDVVGKFFIRGIGGFGDKGLHNEAIPKVPAREPDASFVEPTDANQAFLYRLSGDINPLHVDPNMAALGGFEKPILHGLCTYGVTCRAIYNNYCKGNPETIVSMNARFTSHIFPGETIVVETYKEGSNIHFETKVQEREKVISVGVVQLREDAKL
jgi:acyl dehydratase